MEPNGVAVAEAIPDAGQINDGRTDFFTTSF